MKTSRICAALAATLAMTAAGTAKADGGTVVLNTYSKIWVDGDTRGPDKLGKLTGAGTMDSNFAWDNTAYAADASKVNLATIYTRSSDKPNNNNSYLQGGVAFATLTSTGFTPGAVIDLPTLNGDRTFMRPQVAFLPNGRALLIAASEDNGVNNNPQPVAYVVSTAGGPPLKIPNSTRGADVTKPTNLIKQAQANGINVDDANNQRGPHTITQVNANTYVVGMQYNNQAQEAFSVTVNDDNSIKMNWLVRYSKTARHCRPQVQIAPGATTGYIAAVEANEQPAEIGFRVSQFDVTTGKSLQSKIVIKSDPKNNKYVSEPVMGLMGDKLAISYGITAPARKNKNGNGHAGGAMVGAAVIVNQSDLTVVGDPALAVGQYGRHPSSFVTGYGENAEPALAIIGGSSTGTGAGFVQMYTLGTGGLLDVAGAAAKVYEVSPFADVANVQARGKRNPNDQARGFINGLGSVPNPGYTTDPAKAATSFMPETKAFSFSTVTGYSGAAAMAKGFKNSIWLSLVPAAWQNGLTTTPGTATATPGTNADGTGPAPRVTGTDPSGNDAVTGDDANAKTRNMDLTNSGCAAVGSASTSNAGLIGLALLGIVIAGRRKREEA